MFTLEYKRKTYQVNFKTDIVNNQFPGAVLKTAKPNSQEIKYQGKVRIPDNPVLTKEGYHFNFIQWQDESIMNGVYSQVAGFNFNGDRVENNLNLVPYFTKIAKYVNYTINHVFEGVDDIAERTDTKVHQAPADSEFTVSNDYRQTAYDRYFTVDKQLQTKTIQADGSTVFRLEYKRRLFTVKFSVNFRRRFKDVEETNQPEEQRIKYQGKVKIPATTPGLSRHGRTYQFIQWQNENSMNGYYNKIYPFNFETVRIDRDTYIAAYFEETVHYVDYKIVHYLEKRGPESTLDGEYERVEEVKKYQSVEKGATYSDYKGEHKWMYEKETANPKNKPTAQLNKDDHTTEVVQYYRLTEIDAYFSKTQGVEKLEYERIKVKRTRRVKLPGYTLTNGYEYLGWAPRNNQNSVKDEYIAEYSHLELYLITKPKTVKITYTINSENIDGETYTESKIYKTGKVGQMHYTSFEPDRNIYYITNYTKGNFIISADEAENEVIYTLKRHRRRVYFKYNYDKVDIYKTNYKEKFFIHGSIIGEIDESDIKRQGFEIFKYKVDNKFKTKEVVTNYIVEKEFNVELIIDLPLKLMYKYPQSEDNPYNKVHFKDDIRELKFKSKGKDYTVNFVRKLYKDDAGELYELFHGRYYKFEEVQFVKAPLTDFYMTRDIIDSSVVNMSFNDYLENSNPEHSILNAVVKDIGKIMGVETFMPTYEDAGEFTLKPTYDAHIHSSYFSKEMTDYARAAAASGSIYGDYKYRDVDFSIASENYTAHTFIVNTKYYNRWWLATQHSIGYAMNLRYIDENKNLNSGLIVEKFGVVVCIK